MRIFKPVLIIKQVIGFAVKDLPSKLAGLF